MIKEFEKTSQDIKQVLTGEGKLGSTKAPEEKNKEKAKAIRVEAKEGEAIEAFSKRLNEIKVKMGSDKEVYGDIDGMYLRVKGTDQSIIEDYKMRCMIRKDKKKYSYHLSEIINSEKIKSEEVIFLEPTVGVAYSDFFKEVAEAKAKHLLDYKNIYVEVSSELMTKFDEDSTFNSILLESETQDGFTHEKYIATDEYKQRVAKVEAERKELQQLRVGLKHLIEESRNVDVTKHIEVKRHLAKFHAFWSDERLRISVNFALRDILKELKAKGYRENLNLPRKVTYERYTPLGNENLLHEQTVNAHRLDVHSVSTISPRLSELLDVLKSEDRGKLAQKYWDKFKSEERKESHQINLLRHIGVILDKNEEVAFITLRAEEWEKSLEELAHEVCAIQEFALEYLDSNVYQVCETAEKILPGGRREIVIPILLNRQAQNPPNLITQAILHSSPEVVWVLKMINGKREKRAEEYFAKYKKEESRQQIKENWISEIDSKLQEDEEAYIYSYETDYEWMAREICAIQEVATEHLDQSVYEISEPELIEWTWRPVLGVRIKKK